MVGIFDLCDRILARINFNDGKDVAEAIDGEETSKNLERHRVKLSITKCAPPPLLVRACVLALAPVLARSCLPVCHALMP